jgi:diguanylate cyclase (GGDEF)-like protein
MERIGAIGAVRTALGLLVAGPLLAILVVVRALPPADLDAAGVGWVPPTLAAVLLATAAIATVAWLVVGLRGGGLAAPFVAGASGALAGSALGWLGGSPALIALVVAAIALLGAAIADRSAWTVAGAGSRAAVAGGLLGVAGIAVLLDLLPVVHDAIQPYTVPVTMAGAVAAVAAALVAAGRGVGAIATALLPGLAAAAVATAASLETVIGLAALVGSQLIAITVASLPRGPAAEADTNRLPELATQLTDGVLRFDGRLRLLDWNPAAATLLGLDAAAAGSRLEDLLGISLATMPLPGTALSTVTAVGGLRIGLQRTGEGLTAVIRDPGSSPEAERLGRELRGTIEELLQARRTIDLQRQELERASSVDPLTGTSSRAAIIARLRMEVAQCRRYQHSVAVVLLDIDDFGAVNRAHGTAGGDSALREVALRIRLRVREADELGRFGSDAFLAVLPHTDEGGAATFADALQHRLALRPIMIGSEQVELTASVGIAVMRPGDELDVDGLLARADEALASARRGGGNQVARDRTHGPARLEDHDRATRDAPLDDRGAV